RVLCPLVSGLAGRLRAHAGRNQVRWSARLRGYRARKRHRMSVSSGEERAGRPAHPETIYGAGINRMIRSEPTQEPRIGPYGIPEGESVTFGRYGLPEQVAFCTRCTMSNQRPSSVKETANFKESPKPTLQFDSDGICDACRYAEMKQQLI